MHTLFLEDLLVQRAPCGDLRARTNAHTHAHTHGEADRQTDRQTGRQTDRQTHTHTHTHNHQPIYTCTLASSLLRHKKVSSRAPSLPSVATAASIPLKRASSHPPHTRHNSQAAGTRTFDQTAEMAKKPSSTAPMATARNSRLGGRRPAPRAKLRNGGHGNQAHSQHPRRARP
jgi:hypothetical protein